MLHAISSKQKVRALAVLSAGALATAVVMAGPAGTAHAAQAGPAAIPGQYCGVQNSGTTAIYGKGVGSTWSKQPGCNDLNVVNTETTAPGHWDKFNGNLWLAASHSWYHCKAGFQTLYNGPHDPDNNPRAVLCRTVGNGTTMAIDSLRAVDTVVINS
jgi:hypothetical protein